ncbi:procathepsin L-like [Dipodomys spectabilis]|uniref:procathepsin L-like n=1 Tax=Dipodomys spectabilis TaxID=105255 RepID=UPI001C539659|nr:procathepsin L-like [Dipodomys spectabilis]
MDPSLLLAILCLGMTSAAPVLDPSLDAQWTKWKTEYGKSYHSDEEGWRRAIWEENWKMIEVHNEEERQGKHTYTLEMNAFGDMTDEELQQGETEFQPIRPNEEEQIYPDLLFGDLPASVDWREKGYVTPVKDQGQCNSCWAFCATGALEGQMFKKTGKLVSLSEQNLVDCSRPQNNGCTGGLPHLAYQYVKNNGGLDSEESYPYEAKNGPCRYKPENSAANVTGYVILPPSEQALMRAVATVGPIATGFHSAHSSFKYYRGGIHYNPTCPKYLTHGVVVVGYGYEGEEETENNKYWLIKNSYGTNWGINGYAKVARDRNNHCGIASFSLYPTV